MATTISATSRDAAVARTVAFLDELLAGFGPRDFAMRLWDGTLLDTAPGHPARFTLVLTHPGALRAMLLPPTERALGEAFIFGDYDIEGDILEVFTVGDYLLGSHRDRTSRLRLAGQLLRLPRGRRPRTGRPAARLRGRFHSPERDRAAIAYHYDTSNDFFALFTDEAMQYSCARFAHPGEDLDTAQRRKLDLLCRQLELRPGERLLDIGCGWGGLVLHAAANYGVEAVGYTLSRAQYELANRRIKEAGLADHCRVELCDYRSADFGTFDKIASIEMTAHVAKPQLAAYYAAAWRALRPGGKFLNVWDVRSAAHPVRKRQTFVSSYFFPDAQLVSLDELLEAGEQAGFRIGEVENLRDQYVLTYGAWLERIAARRDELVALVGEPAYRTWVLGFAGCSYQTAIGRVGTYQAMLTRPDPANLTGIDLPLG